MRHALAGNYDELNERFLGVELFGRKVNFDTGADSIVRVRASDVRRRLVQYYSSSQYSVATLVPCRRGVVDAYLLSDGATRHGTGGNAWGIVGPCRTMGTIQVQGRWSQLEPHRPLLCQFCVIDTRHWRKHRGERNHPANGICNLHIPLEYSMFESVSAHQSPLHSLR